MCTVEDVETRAMCTVEDEETSGDLNDTSPSQPSFAEALRGKPLPIWPRTPSRTAGGKGERLPVHHIVLHEFCGIAAFHDIFSANFCAEYV